MKMGDRRLKRLDKLGIDVQSKVRIIGKPTNRAQHRKYEHVLKRERIIRDEIDEEALFEALEDHLRI
jgi:hypothetical protein